MFSSIQAAARWAGWRPGISHWSIALGDQPLVQTDTLRQLIAFAAQRPGLVCQPAHHGRGRHPVILPQSVFAGLADSPANNLKEYLAADPARLARCEMEDAGLDVDLDNPEDYARALQLAQS